MKKIFKFSRVSALSFSAKPGFTLIELLVVISIIALLASVVLVSLSGARSRARDSKRVGDMNQVAKALELFYNDAGAYPTSTNYLSGATFGSDPLAATTAKGTFIIKPDYLMTIPVAPNPADGGCNTVTNPYTYQSNQTGTTYTLTFCLGQDIAGGIKAGTRSLTPGGFR